jgi:hypothetical protein
MKVRPFTPQKGHSIRAVGSPEQLDGIIGSEKGFLRQAAVTLIVFDQENSYGHAVSSDYSAGAKKTANHFNKLESDISSIEDFKCSLLESCKTSSGQSDR